MVHRNNKIWSYLLWSPAITDSHLGTRIKRCILMNMIAPKLE